MTKTHSI